MRITVIIAALSAAVVLCACGERPSAPVTVVFTEGFETVDDESAPREWGELRMGERVVLENRSGEPIEATLRFRVPMAAHVAPGDIFPTRVVVPSSGAVVGPAPDDELRWVSGEVRFVSEPRDNPRRLGATFRATMDDDVWRVIVTADERGWLVADAENPGHGVLRVSQRFVIRNSTDSECEVVIEQIALSFPGAISPNRREPLVLTLPVDGEMHAPGLDAWARSATVRVTCGESLAIGSYSFETLGAEVTVRRDARGAITLTSERFVSEERFAPDMVRTNNLTYDPDAPDSSGGDSFEWWIGDRFVFENAYGFGTPVRMSVFARDDDSGERRPLRSMTLRVPHQGVARWEFEEQVTEVEVMHAVPSPGAEILSHGVATERIELLTEYRRRLRLSRNEDGVPHTAILSEKR